MLNDDCIFQTLSSIGVEELIIPAIPELLQTWTKVFGFMPLEESKRQTMKSMNMLVFPGVNMLQKPLLHNPVADRSPNPSSGTHRCSSFVFVLSIYTLLVPFGLT